MTATTDRTSEAIAAALDDALTRVQSRSIQLSTEAGLCAARLRELAEGLRSASPPAPERRAAEVASAMRGVQVLDAELELACLEVQGLLLRQ